MNSNYNYLKLKIKSTATYVNLEFCDGSEQES